MKKIDYSTYRHSYAHAIEPKLKAINYNANVLKKPVNYVKAIVKNTLKQSGEVIWTEKEQFFFETMMNQTTSYEVYKYCKNAVNKAKTILVDVDDNGELVKRY